MLKVKKRRKNKIRGTVLIILLIIGVWRIERKLTESIDFYVVPVVKQQINAEITKIMQSHISNADLLMLSTDNSGNISNVQVDTAKMAAAKAMISNDVSLYFASNSICTATIRLGHLFDSALLQNVGPQIKFKFYPVSSLVLHENSEFLSAGINQSLQRIVLTAAIEINCIAAGQKIKADVTNSFVIAENVIVGQVPSGIMMD